MVIRGDKGSLVLRGCSWGYGGEGPRGTEYVLKELGVHPFDVEQIAFHAPNKDIPAIAWKRPVEVWRLTLPATCAQLAKGEFVSRVTPEQARAQREALAGLANRL